MAEETYERLSEEVEISGTGIPGLKAKLIERTDNKAMYHRWDDVYEVFRIKKSGVTEMFGKTYTPREVYPGNEDFGKTAWCFKDINYARRRYKTTPDVPVYIGSIGGGIDEGDT